MNLNSVAKNLIIPSLDIPPLVFHAAAMLHGRADGSRGSGSGGKIVL